ncbi:MAG: response regulator [Desulfuromusa sp.]|nr:response regulator [Desulfuromusa sp.]
MMKKLLLADDSITIQKVVGIIFSTEEYQLEMTDDGNSAFDKALAEIPDLVIADISMPGKDGFELCRAIKSEPSLANTSVLLLPGAFDHFDEAKAEDVCADGWLTKPFESQALLDKVSQLLEAEPVKMAGVAAAVTEETPFEAEEGGAESGEDSSVSEAALGLDDMEESQPSTEELDEESPDDIWDAVSFAEDDLQKPEETDSVDSEDEVSFAADVMDSSAVDADVDIEPATDEQVLSAFTDKVDEVDSPVAEVNSDFVEDEPESSVVEEIQPEPFVGADSAAEENIVELSDQVDSSVSVEAAETVDFSAFSDAEEIASDVSEESTDFVSEVENDAPLDLVDELDESPVMTTEESDYSVAETEENEPLELTESDLAEQNTEVDVVEEKSVSFVDESDDEDAIMELSEEDEFEPIVPESIAAEESAVPFAETVADDLSGDDEILDLSVDEIIDEEAPEEETVAEIIEDEASVEETVDEAAAEEPETFVAEETELESEPELESTPETEFEPVDGITDLVDEEIELVEEVETLSAVAEDEDFYFDATAEDDEVVTSNAVAAVTAGAAGLAAGVAVTHLAGTDEDDGSATEQVEQQLRELSEDELKEVVAKVAGPMIEKLAAEMVEKIAWEVVPDLAETMISEEIRKIKEGV